MKSLLTILVFTFSIFPMLSQSCEWAKNIGGNGSDLVRKTIVDKHNNFYVVGSFNSDSLYFNNGKFLINNNIEYGFMDTIEVYNNYQDGFIAKYDAIGNCIWTHRIGGRNNDYINDIGLDYFGNLYIIFDSNSDTVRLDNHTLFINDYSSVSSIIKFNISGIFQWVENINSTSYKTLTSINIDFEGNVILGGIMFSSTLYFNNNISITNSKIPLANNNRRDCFIAKYNPDGNCLWADVFKGFGNNKVYWYGWETINSIVSDSIGNIFIAGNYSSDIDSLIFNNGVTLINSGRGDGFVANYNSLGICKGAIKISGKNQDYVTGVAVDSEHFLYIIGYSDSDTLRFNNGINLFKSKNYLFEFYSFISKYDLNGNCLSVERISGSGTYIFNITFNTDRNIYVIGRSDSNVDFNNGISLKKEPKSTYYSYIAQFGSNLLCNWAEQVYGDKTVDVEGMAVYDSKNIYICGFYNSNNIYFNNGFELSNSIKGNTNSSDQDSFIAKFTQNPNSVSKVLVTNCFIISPNPATDFITIQFKTSEVLETSEVYKVQISDMLGLEIAQTPSSVHNGQTGATDLRIDISHLPAGVYFIRIGDKYEKFVKM